MKSRAAFAPVAAVVLAALLGLSAPALARHAEGSENAAALEALVADPQLVISRESLIASMTDPETRPSDAASSSAGDTSHSGVPAQDTDQDQQARAGASPKAGSEPRNRPLPVETALTIASAVLEDLAGTKETPASQQHPQQQQQQREQPQQQNAASVDDPTHELHVSEQQDSRSDAGALNETAPATAAAQAAEQRSGPAGEEDEEDEDEDDVELRTADGDLPVRWLDCKESWWRQCLDPADGRVIQPVAVQRMAAALGGLWTSTVGDGTLAADMPQRRPGGAGSAGEGAACAEYREAMEAGLGNSVRQNRTHLTSTTSVCHPLRIHVVVPLDEASFRGALATINSVISNAACPERLLFHVPSLDADHRAQKATSMQDTFENVHLYQYDKEDLSKLISPTLKADIPDLASYMQWFPDRYLPHCVERLIALESGTLVLSDVGRLWDTPLAPGAVIAAPQNSSVSVATLISSHVPPEILIHYVQKVYDSRAVRRGLALMNVTAWGAANMTEAVEEWLGSGRMRVYLADPSRRYDEDRYALQAVQSATVGRVQRLSSKWIRLLDGDRCGGKARAVLGRSKALRWTAQHSPWQSVGASSKGTVSEDCEVDSVWHKYDVRSAADSTADTSKGPMQKRDAFVTQRRRQLLGTTWSWPWQ